MDWMLFYILNPLVNALVATILGFVVYFRNRKELVNRVFGIFCGVVALWSYSYFTLFFVRDPLIGAFYHRLFLTVPAIFIAILFFHFVLAFISKTEENKNKLKIGYIIFTLFVFIDLFTPFFIEKLEQKLFLGLWPTAGPLYLPFLMVWWFYFLWAIYFILKEIRNLPDGKKSLKTQLAYILIGALIGFVGGGVINYLLWYDIPVPPVTTFLVAAGMIIIAYGIVKHHLFNIKLLISELLVFTIWIFVIARTVLSANFQELVINGILAILVFIVGVMLMQSVSKEIEAEKKALKETQKNLEFEQRFSQTVINMSGSIIKKMEEVMKRLEEMVLTKPSKKKK